MEWQALEYEHWEKGPRWFGVLATLAGLGVVLAVLFKNILLAVLLAVAAAAVALYAARPPQIVSYALLTRGVKIGQTLYLYDDLKSFWVADDSHRQYIILESKKVFLPHILVPLGEGVAPESARQYLAGYLPEVRHHESLADILGDLVGF